VRPSTSDADWLLIAELFANGFERGAVVLVRYCHSLDRSSRRIDLIVERQQLPEAILVSNARFHMMGYELASRRA
jgi:hypothetical protein